MHRTVDGAGCAIGFIDEPQPFFTHIASQPDAGMRLFRSRRVHEELFAGYGWQGRHHGFGNLSGSGVLTRITSGACMKQQRTKGLVQLEAGGKDTAVQDVSGFILTLILLKRDSFIGNRIIRHKGAFIQHL